MRLASRAAGGLWLAMALLTAGAAWPARGQDPDEEEAQAAADSAIWAEEEGEEEAQPAGPQRTSADEILIGPWPRLVSGAQDTVRTNLWLARALLADAVREVARALPPAPRAVVIKPMEKSEANDLLIAAAQAVLSEAGHELYLDETQLAGAKQQAAPPQAPPDALELRLRVEEIGLKYPRAGRRLGLWRQWVDRRLRATVLVSLLETSTGRLLMDERVVRTFEDRVAAEGFDDVRSTSYAFTDAQIPESGWRHRAEQTVVLGSLIGLIAIYFANTGR